MKKGLCIISIIGILAIGAVSVTAEAKEDAVLDKIDVTVVPAQKEIVCAFITNNSDTIIDELDLQLNYKDKDGNTIDLDKDGHDMILPGYTVVSRLSAPEEYASCEPVVEIELGVNPRYENHSEDVEVKANKGDDCAILEITNNSDVEIAEIEYIAVYFDANGEVLYVDYPQDVYDVESGKTITEKIDNPINWDTHEPYEYDKCSVYLNQAHTFGF